MITFIIHLRKDSEERKKNIDMVFEYYNSIYPNSNFIFIEDDDSKKLEYLSKHSNVNYIHYFNSGEYKKCLSYNIGLKECDNNIVCFLDIDCIVSKENLEQAIQQCNEDNSICICYNGTSIYFNYNIKNKINKNIIKNGLYDFLDNYVQKDKIYTMYACEDYTVGNTKSVGGALLGKKEAFLEIGGFNPNFIGWGYEDNEIVERCKILKTPMYYINTKKPLLFHLPHEISSNRDKSKHPFYKTNEKEISKIMSMDFKKLKEYSSLWLK